MILSMIVYDLNYSRIGDRSKHTVDDACTGDTSDVFTARS
jgi:hypothetical protein